MIYNYNFTVVVLMSINYICSAGNGQWPGGQMRLTFVWGYQKSLKLKYYLKWPKFILAIKTEW